MSFKIFDGRDSFYQWDLNQKVIVDGITINDEIHFKNIDGTGALVVKPYNFSGKIVVDVPNILLQKANSITVWAYVHNFGYVDNDHTKEQAVFNVIPRQKPADYIYTPTEVSVWKVLEEAVENIPNEYAKKNHVHSQYLTKETDPSVEDWAKKGSEYEITGNPVTLENIEHMPMNVVTTLEPIRAGSGNPSATNVRPISGWTGAKLTRCGKNFISAPGSVELRNATYIYDAAGGMFTLTKGAESVWGQIVFKLEMDMSQFVGRKLTLSCADATCTYAGDESRIYVMRQDKSTTINKMSLNTGANSLTFTVPQGVTALYLIVRIDQNKTAPEGTVLTVRGLHLEIGEVATEFEPYASDTFSVNFDQTVYGGTLDWNTGVLTVDCLMSTLDGSTDEGWTIFTSEVTANKSFYTSGYSALPGIVATGNKQIPGWCSWADTQDGIIAGMRRTADDSDRIFIPADTLTGWGVTAGDVNGFKALLAENPMQIVYKVATPTTIQLTPHEIEALRGVNTLYGDGSLNVSGSKDVYWFASHLAKRIKTLESAIISLGGNI